MNSITLLLNIIALFFTFWQSDSSCDIRGPFKRSIHTQHISGGKLDPRVGRILHEADETSTETFSNSNIPYVTLVDSSDSYIDYVQLHEVEAEDIIQSEFLQKLSSQWYGAIIEMASEYVDFTELMDAQWRNKMWTDIWVKYLSRISHDLDIYFSYTFLPISCKQEIFNNLLCLTRDDFKAFLSTIDDKWNEELNKNAL
ncbi:hypothetical protein C922_05596 [Plasmodium inui San Antonio 1]|uniref:Plasmodium RESA N-terminal domain-containing protein n=1 Tax=Plasmodium inui San Antonio 1 TaxID=1237626 RepID=W7AFH7_9APIC|nr:hypothetical protein C922_05596 [Plasmodium inui San Antonio 1]EUD64021.1 hypothetical protein C922_05596 [Plasmodium inui San Antonio 1]